MTRDANRGGSVTSGPAIVTRPKSEVGFARVAGPALLVALYGALAAWSWGKWIDPQIDFGNQLYIP